jgi:pyruvate formate lyase activating enzyme
MVGAWHTVEQVMDIIVRDVVYYRNSGGGVTFSGGEPMAQPQFLASCLQRCQELGIHTAVDTCGFAEWPEWEEILPFTDLLLYDIKCQDSGKHREFTGVGNERILENLKRIGQQGKRVWARVPLVPGYTDSEENLRCIAEFIRPLKSIEKVSLLPYNAAAGAKYQFIGRTYPLENLTPLSDERHKAFVGIFSALGIQAELGR